MTDRPETEAVRTVVSEFLSKGIFDIFKASAGPALAGMAATPLGWPVAVTSLIAYLGLEGTKAWKAAKSKKEQAQILREILSGTEASRKQIDELWTDSIYAELDRTQMIERLNRLQNVCASMKGQLDAIESGQTDVAVLTETLLAEHGDLVREYQLGIESQLNAIKTQLESDHTKLWDVLTRYLENRPLLQNPALAHDKNDPWQNALFNYQYQKVPFVGREDETRRIGQFLATRPDAPVLWYPIVGPGGSGKSRLTLETCDEWRRKGWYTGFLDSDWLTQHVGDTPWVPSYNTLIVVDYVAERAETLGRYIAKLHDSAKQGNWKHVIRFLLLERDMRTGWLEQLYTANSEILRSHTRARLLPLGVATSSDKERNTDDAGRMSSGMIKSAYGQDEDAEAIVLGPMQRDDIVKILGSVEGVVVSEENIQSLLQLGADALPLYVIFAADALASGRPIRDWSRLGLSRLVIDHCRRMWKTGGIDCTTDRGRKQITLLRLATMGRGIRLKIDERGFACAFRDRLPAWNGFDDSLFRQVDQNHLLMTGRSVKATDGLDQMDIPPLEPDILGEYFVLYPLEENPSEIQIQAHRGLLRSLWNAASGGDQNSAYQFLARAVSDYPEQVVLMNLLQDVPNTLGGALVLWAAVHPLTSCGRHGDADAAIGRIEKMYVADTADATVGLILATAMFDKAIAQGEQGDPAGEIATYDKLIAEFGESSVPGVQEQVAKAYVNKGTRQGQQGDSAGAIATYSELISKFSDSTVPGVQKAVVRAYVKKAITQVLQKDADEAISTYSELISKFGESSVPGVQEAVATAYVCKGYRQGQTDAAAEIKTYEVLISKFSDSTVPGVQEQVAKAYVNKGTRQGQQGDSAGAIATYSELISKFSDSTVPGVQERVVRAYVNKGNIQGKQKDAVGAIATYDALITEFGDSPVSGVQGPVAMAFYLRAAALCQLWKANGDRSTLDEAIRSGREAERRGAGGYNLACALALAEQWDEAFDWLEKSLASGKISWKHVDDDPDWSNARNDPRYLALKERFSKDQ